jgi:predicted N-acetyltransferase YhbS
VILRVLQPADDRSGFACGDPDCDNFLRRYAAQNQFDHHISTTLVVVEEERVVAYATFSAAEVSRDGMPPDSARGLPAYPLPALRLGRLAVDVRYQGIGLGSRLVREVLDTSLRLRRELGCAAVIVDALPEAKDFYANLGFEKAVVRAGRPRIPATVLMILPLSDVEVAAQE